MLSQGGARKWRACTRMYHRLTSATQSISCVRLSVLENETKIDLVSQRTQSPEDLPGFFCLCKTQTQSGITRCSHLVQLLFSTPLNVEAFTAAL